MNISKNSQKGQALILIALGIVGLVGITALAIDGGNAFSERRHAQNAADTAALAGALELVQDQNKLVLDSDSDGQLWNQAADAAALANGYANSDPKVTVVIHSPPQADCKGNTTGPYYYRPNYVQVIIEQDVDTYFAEVVGIPQTHSCVESIALAQPSIPPFSGAAIIALDCTAKWAISAGGTSNIQVNGGGLYSNSNHLQPIYILNPENLVLQPGFKANMVGNGVSLCNSALPTGYPYSCGIPQKTPCPPLPDDDPLLPKYTCDYTIPGDFKPADGTVLAPGIYCLGGRFRESNFSVDTQSGIEGATFVMLNFGIAWSGNSSITISSPTTGPTKGILFYLPPSNDKAVTINGTALIHLIGTILAPSSEVTLNGTVDGDAFKSSVIGRTVKLTGTGVFNINYDSEKNYWLPPQIELTK